MDRPDLEQRIDNAMFGLLSAIWSGTLEFGWPVADRAFRLTTWTIAIGALQGLQQKSGSEELRYTVLVLLLLLFIAIFVSVINALRLLTDRASEHFGARLSSGWSLGLTAIFTLTVVPVGIDLVLPTVARSVVVILEAISR